jgi:SAM-dependent methyltransferase
MAAADEGLVEALHSLDGAVNYRDWILSLAAPYLAGASAIAEVGAGHGTFTESLAAFAPTVAVEPGIRARERLDSRFEHVDRITVLAGTAADLPDAGFDGIFMSNVLEHIEDDVAALRDLCRALLPGGHAVVFSPAFRLLYSDFDARVGHHHRYRLKSIRARFEQAGLSVIDTRYVNSVGFFTWLLYVRLLRRSPENASAVRLYDRAIVPLLERLERRIRPPFGQSVFIVGRKD